MEMAKSRMLSRYPSRMSHPILANRNPHQAKCKDRGIVKRRKYAVAEIAVANKFQAKRDQKVRVKERKMRKIKPCWSEQTRRKKSKCNKRAKNIRRGKS